MPIPMPNENEEQNTFIGRCTGIIKGEFPDNKQRTAICYSQWRKSKKDSVDNVDRNICFNIDAQSNLKLDQQTGFLYGKAYVTRSGVFDYYDLDGNLMRELRSPEEVFDKESMDSIKLKPIVYDHPEKMVTVDNIKDLQVGTIGDSAEKDGIFLSTNIVITDKDIIQNVLDKKKAGLTTELSCGYSCDLIPEYGVHDSEGYYTFKQSKIRYNHVGIVDKARAGKNVRILDKLTNKNKEFTMSKVQFVRNAINLDSFKVDAISGQFDDESIIVISSFSNKLDEASTIIDSITKDKNALQGKLDQANENTIELNKKLDTFTNIDSLEVITMFNERKNVLDVAEKLSVECKDKNLKDIKIDCIKKVSEDFDSANKTDEYINARFDSINDLIEIKNNKDSKNYYANFMKNMKDAQGSKIVNPRDNFIKKDKEQNRKQ